MSRVGIKCYFEIGYLHYWNVNFTVAKQNRSLELKSASLACDYSVADYVDKDSKLIKPPSGKKAVLDWEV